MKIAIIGKCSNSRGDAPLDLDDWLIWGLAWDPLPRCNAYFEMHQNWRNFLGGGDAAEAHWRWLAGMTVPVYMLQKEHDIPESVEYPMDRIADMMGRTCHGTAYLESSISYMMALAIIEMRPDGKQAFNGDCIGVWGCDLSTGGEYAYQRPNMEYLIGYARALGIKVYVPAQNALLSPCRKVPYGLDDPEAGEKPERPDWMPSLEPKEETCSPSSHKPFSLSPRKTPVTYRPTLSASMSAARET